MKTEKEIIAHLVSCFSDANWADACLVLPELWEIKDEIEEKEEQENP